MGLIKLPNQSIDFFKKNIDDIFQTGSLAEGQWNKEISSFVSNLTSSKFSVPTNSNGAGLVALISLYRHYFNRKKVYIQSNTMYGVKTMIIAGGCHLGGFIPCIIPTLMPSIDDVKKIVDKMSIKDKNETIFLLSHIGGIINPDIELISSLCKKENIILLEDCAHSFGSTLNGQHSGLFGDAGVYSFYATKAIPAGEGGTVVTNDIEIGQMITDYIIYDRFEQKLELGNNIRNSEIQALLIFSVLKEWKNIILNKSKIAQKYIDICKEKNIKYIHQDKDENLGNYYKFTIYTENRKISDAFPNLKTKTSPVYDYSIGCKNEVAEYHACLPIWYNQESHVVDQVVQEL